MQDYFITIYSDKSPPVFEYYSDPAEAMLRQVELLKKGVMFILYEANIILDNSTT